MAIKVNITGAAYTGKTVTFTAPCDCASVTDGLSINGEIYTVCDAMGKCVTGVGGTWAKGAQVSVVLDCENKKAYIQNAAGGGAAKEHASAHAIGGSDPITYDMIGAAPAPLKEDLTLYVSNSGSDETGDGTQANPFATIQHAVDTVPKNLGGYRVVINVGAGTFKGATISGFYGGSYVGVVGNSNTTTHITSDIIIAENASLVYLTHLHSSASLNCSKCSSVQVTNSIFDGTGTYGIVIAQTGTAFIYKCSVSNKNYAVTLYSGQCEVSSLSGSGNTLGYIAGNSSSGAGGLLLLRNNTLTASTVYSKYTSGHIIENNAFK